MYSAAQMPRIPSLTLPTPNFEEMLVMSNRRLVCVLRAAVLAPGKAERFSPRPPEDHDAYTVLHEPGRIVVQLYQNGEVVFHCCFVPPRDYA